MYFDEVGLKMKSIIMLILLILIASTKSTSPDNDNTITKIYYYEELDPLFQLDFSTTPDNIIRLTYLISLANNIIPYYKGT